ncbi:MAG TPA: hypothetical protein VD886_01800 [Herpetosiphonaceae bacterium]|nr:hypothetical protein [Herpetosiphonaceae bacterium]
MAELNHRPADADGSADTHTWVPGADDALYAEILAEADAFVAGFAPPMRALLAASLEPMRARAFVRLAALLPAALADLAPVAPETARRLGLANLYAAWYYHAQDDLLDGQAAASDWLVGHLVFGQAIETYRGLGLVGAPVWAEFGRLGHRSADAYALELQQRFSAVGALGPDQLAAFSLEFLLDRVGPLFFSPLAQLHLAGIPAHAERAKDLIEALRCWAAARQIGDDARDWLDDLKAGQLNYVAARLIERWIPDGGERTLERLATFHLTADECWAEIERTAGSLTHSALDLLAPYGPSRLRGLVDRQLAEQAELWAALRAKRAEFRAMFGL